MKLPGITLMKAVMKTPIDLYITELFLLYNNEKNKIKKLISASHSYPCCVI